MSARVLEAARAWLPVRGRQRPSAQHTCAPDEARLERHGGLTVLYLSGTPYEMGYQQGALARDLIHGFRRAAYTYVTALLPVPAWLARLLLFFHSAAYWPTIPEDLAEEMRGIAHGAGVHPIEVLVSTAIWEIMLVSGCSEFAAVAPVTADGSLLHGYNYDLMHPDHALIQPFLAVLFCRPSDGVPFFTVNTVGSVGANAGMNEAGISVAWDNTSLSDEQLTRGIGLPVVPFIITLRRLLQFATSLEEAVQIVVRSLPRPLGDIIIIGSAREGRAVALETAGRVYAIREMQEGAVWSTNCFRSPELAPHDRRGDGCGLPTDAAWQRFPRYSAYAQLFASTRGRLTPNMAAAFLRDPYPREASGFVHPAPVPRATICREFTSWSLIMEPGKGRFWCSDTRIPGCQGHFFAFDLHGRERLPELDLPPSGYAFAVESARHFQVGDLAAAREALAAASALDGPSAPLSLMQAALYGLEGAEPQAAEILLQVETSWPQTGASALARAWLEGSDQTELAIPFPSAIRPYYMLRPGAGWEQRIVPAVA